LGHHRYIMFHGAALRVIGLPGQIVAVIVTDNGIGSSAYAFESMEVIHREGCQFLTFVCFVEYLIRGGAGYCGRERCSSILVFVFSRPEACIANGCYR
jgi:hypothetical protein